MDRSRTGRLWMEGVRDRAPSVGFVRCLSNPRIRHETRDDFAASLPCHVTLPVRRDVPSLRSGPVVREVESSFRKACDRGTFRLVHYSIQDDHVHLLVEAEGAKALGRGMRSIAARFARAVNRALKRSGPVLRDRYHFNVLRTPTQVRGAARNRVHRHRRPPTPTPPKPSGPGPAPSGSGPFRRGVRGRQASDTPRTPGEDASTPTWAARPSCRRSRSRTSPSSRG